MNILELFAHIGLKADTAPANDFLKSIGGIKGQLVGAIAGTLSLAASVRTVNEQFSAALDMKRFADDTGESVEEMQKWKAVAQQVSGAGDSVASSIRAITANQEKIRLGQGSISGYQLLGIDPRSDPFKVLEAIRTKTQGLSQGMRRNIAQQFGISNDLVATLELTNKQFDEMAANAFVIPQGNIDSMNKARASLETVKNAANWFKAELVTQLAPSIENISKKIAEWIRQNKDGLIKGIQTAFEWMQRVVTMIMRFGIIVNDLINRTMGWKNAIIALGVAFVALNAEIMLPIAAIFLLMAVLEDIYLYSQGQDSLIGRFLKGMPALKAIFDDLLTVVNAFVTAWGAVFSGDFTKLDEMTKKWGIFGDVLKVVAHAIEIIKSGLSSKGFNESVAGIKKEGFFQEYGKEWGNLWDKVTSTDWLGKKPDAALATSSGTTTVTIAPNITINGATDTTATKNAVSNVMNKSLGDAYIQGQSPKREVSSY